MIYGLYLSTSGAMMQQARQEVISNNLANVSTTGFKKDVMVMQQIQTQAAKRGMSPFKLNRLEEKIGGSVMIDATHSIHTRGSIKATDNPLDVMIQGEKGFLAVGKGNDTFYTRSSTLTINANRQLVTGDGKYEVLNAEGEAIFLPDGEVSIGDTGQVTVDGAVVATLGTADFSDYSKLQKTGDNLFMDMGAGLLPEALVQVRSGMLETSNVSSVAEMVKMIEGHRIYEANMKMIQSQDETLGRAVNDVGRVAS